MSNPNPNASSVIVPATYDQEITIVYDTRTGKSELRTKNPLNELLMAGILSSHASALITKIITDSVKQKGFIQ